jgi:hypothetical protein
MRLVGAMLATLIALAAPAFAQLPSQYPPGQYPPNTYPPGQYPPNTYPPGQYLPITEHLSHAIARRDTESPVPEVKSLRRTTKGRGDEDYGRGRTVLRRLREKDLLLKFVRAFCASLIAKTVSEQGRELVRDSLPHPGDRFGAGEPG